MGVSDGVLKTDLGRVLLKLEALQDEAILQTDAYSRKVVGWAFGVRMTAELVLSALNMALHTQQA